MGECVEVGRGGGLCLGVACEGRRWWRLGLILTAGTVGGRRERRGGVVDDGKLIEQAEAGEPLLERAQRRAVGSAQRRHLGEQLRHP